MAYVTGRRHPSEGISSRHPRQGIQAGYWDDEPLLPDLYVPGPNHVDTGLVTETGDPIYRTQPPIGFGRDNEW